MICIVCLRGWLLRGEGAFFRCPLFGQTQGSAPTVGAVCPYGWSERIFLRSVRTLRPFRRS